MKKLKISVLWLSVFILISGASLPAAEKDFMPAGRYAQMVYLRMISIARTILEYDAEVIFRLENKRKIDKPMVKARFISARLQFKKLLKLGRRLENKMTSSDPDRARVESLRKRLPYFIKSHQSNMIKINSLGDFDDVKIESNKLIEAIKVRSKQSELKTLTINNLESAF